MAIWTVWESRTSRTGSGRLTSSWTWDWAPSGTPRVRLRPATTCSSWRWKSWEWRPSWAPAATWRPTTTPSRPICASWWGPPSTTASSTMIKRIRIKRIPRCWNPERSSWTISNVPGRKGVWPRSALIRTGAPGIPIPGFLPFILWDLGLINFQSMRNKRMLKRSRNRENKNSI